MFMFRNTHSLFLISIIFGTMTFWGSSIQGPYDRVWWGSTPKDERTEFIAGYIDCATYDRGNAELANAQWNLIEPKITTYYASHPDAIHRMVPSLILALGSGGGSTDQAGEQYPEKHGIFDGDYWRQITPSGRIGFVEGYLACRNAEHETRQFSARSADWYVSQIDGTYRLTREGDIDDSRASKKIATIIQDLSSQSDSNPGR